MPNSMTSPIRDEPDADLCEPVEPERRPQSPVEEEPFLIDPGSEDPGAGIDQLPGMGQPELPESRR
jgi:hypothetical protein